MVDEHSSNVRTQFVKGNSPNRNELNSDKLHEAVEYLSVIKSTDSDSSVPQLTVVMSDTPCLDEFDRGAGTSIEPRDNNTILCSATQLTDQLDEYDDQKTDVQKNKQSTAIIINDDSKDLYIDELGIKNFNSDEQCSPRGIGNDVSSVCTMESPKPSTSQQGDKDSPPPISPQNSNCSKDELAILAIPKGSTATSAAIRRLRVENEQLQAEVTRLRRLVVSGAFSLLNEKKPSALENVTSPSSSAVGNDVEETVVSPKRFQSLQIELQLTKEALSSLKSDRRRLKAEKFELLHQMKQLYDTIEDKEKQLRDFIRNYEQIHLYDFKRMRDNASSLQQLSTEREERERERWSLLRHARDEAERSLLLAAQLNAKDLQLQHTQEQLQDVRRQLASSGCFSDQESVVSMPRHSLNGGAITPSSGGFPTTAHSLGLLTSDRGSCSADSGVRVNSDRESGATSIGGNLSDSTIDGTPAIRIANDIDVDAISIVSSIPPPHMYQSSTKDSSPTLSPANAPPFSKSVGSTVLSRSVEQLSSPLDPEPVQLGRRFKNSHGRVGGGRGGTWGSISRVFARSRNRNKSQSLHDNSESNLEAYRNWSPLTEEGYAEKLKLLREASSVPMERWRAPTVVAWLEVALGMPQYGTRCAENIKSGKVLLELSDFELECGLGITHPMHRKKLRLAIEEHRHPEMIRYNYIAQLGHTWVSSEWLPDLGLSQYADGFATNLVDARVLEHLSKKELEKYLGVTRKFHQASIVHGIHLLRIVKYDRQALAVRRHQCENMDTDPLVWTNQRFIRWARNIDLGEYADNLKDSGVHGGLVVLEPSFNGDTMASALGIPASKNIIRRHLNAELDALVLPARYIMFCQMDEFQMETPRSSSKHFRMGKAKINNC